MREIASSSIDKNYALKPIPWRQEHPKINQLDIWTWGTTKCSVRHFYHAKPALAGQVERGAQVASPTKAFTAHGSLYSLSARRGTPSARLSTCVRTGLALDPKIPWVKLVIWTLLGKKTKDDRAFHFFWESHKAQCDNKRCSKYSVW